MIPSFGTAVTVGGAEIRLSVLGLRTHILQFTFYHHCAKIMAPKNKGKKGKNADDDAFWCVTIDSLHDVMML
jgi:hypothetical protein